MSYWRHWEHKDTNDSLLLINTCMHNENVILSVVYVLNLAPGQLCAHHTHRDTLVELIECTDNKLLEQPFVAQESVIPKFNTHSGMCCFLLWPILHSDKTAAKNIGQPKLKH